MIIYASKGVNNNESNEIFSVGHIAFGQFDLSLVVLLCSGSVVGAYLGPGLLGRIDSKNLERGFGPLFILVMLLMGLVMVFR